jgi:hypothetical protein
MNIVTQVAAEFLRLILRRFTLVTAARVRADVAEQDFHAKYEYYRRVFDRLEEARASLRSLRHQMAGANPLINVTLAAAPGEAKDEPDFYGANPDNEQAICLACASFTSGLVSSHVCQVAALPTMRMRRAAHPAVARTVPETENTFTDLTDLPERLNVELGALVIRRQFSYRRTEVVEYQTWMAVSEALVLEAAYEAGIHSVNATPSAWACRCCNQGVGSLTWSDHICDFPRPPAQCRSSSVRPGHPDQWY